MYPEKDWATYIQAARTLSDSRPGAWRFIALGDGPERDRVLESAEDLVTSGVMEFPDGGTEVMPIVGAADIGVLLTDTRIASEGCSNSIMEYMACGLPVVCTDAGGNKELVVEGVTGNRISPLDAAPLVETLNTLRSDRSKAAEMGRAGRERMAMEFSVERMVEEYIAVYEWVLER